MSHKFIFPQMFDVRPRKETGDLDLEKIEKIVKVLNLKIEEEFEEVMPRERIIDLKNQPIGIYVEDEPIRKKRGKKAKIASLASEDEVILPRLASSFAEASAGRPVPSLFTEKELDFWPEFHREVSPSQSEIIAILEMIEATDQALKKPDEEKNVDEIEDEDPGEGAAYEIPINFLAGSGEKARVGEADEAKETENKPSFFATEASPIGLPADEFGLGSEEILEEIENLSQPFSFKPAGIEAGGTDILDLAPEPSAYFSPVEEIESEGPAFSILGIGSDLREELPQGYGQSIRRWLRPKNPASFLQNEIIAPELLLDRRPIISFDWRKLKKPLLVFTAAAVLILAAAPLFGWFNRILIAKNEALNSGMAAYQSLISAKETLTQLNFVQAEKDFKAAHDYFSKADSQIRGAAGWLVFILERIPGISYFSSRTKLIAVGQDMSKAGQSFASIASLFGDISLDFSKNSQNQSPISGNLTQAKNYLEDGLRLLVSAKQNLDDIKISSLPEDVWPQMVLLEEKMPQIVETAALALDWTGKFLKILGHENAKKYLLIFQNNAEARPTGGFVGTYGILDLDQGQIKNLFIDGIYNPDGQLKEKVIPPQPIQKISTAWSTHDANWFGDFPLSAQKMMWFWEKTGGPTVDGVISLTPTVIERLLEITGPIEMPAYGVTLDHKNFVDATQQEVEVDYDKVLNQPKKILADFAPKFIDKVAEEIKNNNLEILKIINGALKEKHILAYFGDEELEQFVKQQGWAGEILPASGDYLAAVNTNINGFKTDRVVKEDIEYVSEIQADGSIVNAVSVTRRHQGGSYDWYNRVNADYLRVYVPRGSELLSASGQTRETVAQPIDYAAAGFKADSDVLAQEQGMKIDKASGTQIFEESGKTVFGNWVYVGPGESATLTYKYRLPFKLELSKPADFSLIVQKQSGSIGSGFSGEIKLPAGWKILQPSPDFIKIDSNSLKWESDLSVDRVLEFMIGDN